MPKTVPTCEPHPHSAFEGDSARDDKPMAKVDPGAEDLRALFRSMAWFVPIAGLLTVAYVNEYNPSWCSAGFAGCLGAMLVYAGGGFLLGACISIYAIHSNPRFPRLALAALLLNVLGAIPFVAFMIMIAR